MVVDGNVAYHLTHNAGKSWKMQKKVRTPEFNSDGSVPLDRPAVGPARLIYYPEEGSHAAQETGLAEGPKMAAAVGPS
jgi:hypothetical protein